MINVDDILKSITQGIKKDLVKGIKMVNSAVMVVEQPDVTESVQISEEILTDEFLSCVEDFVSGTISTSSRGGSKLLRSEEQTVAETEEVVFMQEFVPSNRQFSSQINQL